METCKLGYSDLRPTRIGLGTWAIGGGGWDYGWGPQDDARCLATIYSHKKDRRSCRTEAVVVRNVLCARKATEGCRDGFE